MMSHELRTPLNAIGGYAQLLGQGLAGPLTEQQHRYVERVTASSRHLLGLINDVLNFAKLEAKVEFEVAEVSLADVVTDAVPLIEPQLRAKGLRLTSALPSVGPADSGADAHGADAERNAGAARRLLVWADREKLGQVLLNLLVNAVKFTRAQQRDGSPGEITVGVDDVASPDMVSLTVRDIALGQAERGKAGARANRSLDSQAYGARLASAGDAAPATARAPGARRASRGSPVPRAR